jgi:hypothetical protein
MFLTYFIETFKVPEKGLNPGYIKNKDIELIELLKVFDNTSLCPE